MTKFSDLKLDPKVLKAVAEAGYETPTPIQAGAIPPALEGRDVLGIAQTGTGKTASFTLPMITRLSRGRARARMPRSLVLCPTRELAAQVAENFDTYAKHTRLTKALLIGGVSFGEQDKLIDRGVDVLIATPGRLLDHFERGKLLLTGVEVMVVDEADRMLDMGFIPDIERIFQLTPFTRQTLFFSATMAPEIERITNTFLHTPERIEVARQATTSETITQKLVEITPTRKDQTAKQKRELLRALINAEGEALKNAIIFCNRKTEVDIVAKSLKAHGFDAAPIHGDLEQSQRMRTLDAFRDGSLRFLIASDVAARGLDIPAVSHVFNFDLPSHAEDYVHRIGRTGRAGREGTAYSIATPSDEKYLTAIEHLVKHALPRVAAPEGFSLSDAATQAPRPRREEPGRSSKGSRTRSRRGDRRDDAERSTEPQEIVRETVREEPRAEAPAPRREERPREERRDDRGNGRREDRREDRRDDRRESAAREDRRPESRQDAPRPDQREERPREDRRDFRDDRRRNDRRDHGSSVKGMGEHVPEFMKQSFAAALAATEEAIIRAEAEPAIVEAAVEAPVEDAKPARTRSRGRGRRKDAPEATDAVTEIAIEVIDAPATEATETAAEVEAKPKTRSRTRSRKPAAGTEPADAAPVTEAPAEAATDAADAPAKPKRAPRARKAKPVEVVDGEASVDAEAKPAPKKRAPRARKPAAAAPESAPDAAEG